MAAKFDVLLQCGGGATLTVGRSRVLFLQAAIARRRAGAIVGINLGIAPCQNCLRRRPPRVTRTPSGGTCSENLSAVPRRTRRRRQEHPRQRRPLSGSNRISRGSRAPRGCRRSGQGTGERISNAGGTDRPPGSSEQGSYPAF
jgi:hypothetical protein